LKKVVVYAIIALWAVMAALFVRREVIPRMYAEPLSGYAAARQYARSHAGYRMGITWQGRRVGHIETTYEVKDTGECEISSKAEIDIPHPLAMAPTDGEEIIPRFELFTNVLIKPNNELDSFRINGQAGELWMVANGLVKGSGLLVTINVNGLASERLIPIRRDDVVLSGFVTAGFMPDLRVGQRWRTKALNPYTFQFTSAYSTVTELTTLKLRGHTYEVFVVETELGVGGSTGKTYVDRSGNVLCEQTYSLLFTREPLPHESPIGLPSSADPEP